MGVTIDATGAMGTAIDCLGETVLLTEAGRGIPRRLPHRAANVPSIPWRKRDMVAPI
tara:strand:+ start:827 stop:997 length:171 start_codon:yes stop_codon:yes gene_type:complete